MRLDRELALKAYQPIADRLNFSVEKTAQGMLGIVVANMVRTIRTISIERGHDPRDFVLMPFGGAGPLHAREVAVNLGIKEMVIPAAPGIVCAQGLLVSDLKEDFVESRRIEMTSSGMEALSEILKELNFKAQEWFFSEGASPEGRRLQLLVDARYVGQNFELAVHIASGESLFADDIFNPNSLIKAFCEAHDQAYGYSSDTDPVEIVNVRLSASARLHNFEQNSALPINAPKEQLVLRDTRLVYFDDKDPVETLVYSRDELKPGQRIEGPAILEQMDTTTPVYPHDIAEVTAEGHLIITIFPGAFK